VIASLSDILAYVTFGAGTIVLLIVNAPLWTLIALGGALPTLMGVYAFAGFLARRLPHRLRPSLVEREPLREFVGLSGNLFVLGIADLVIYSLDRTILAANRPASTVGQYEGPVRVHNLIRQINGTLVLTVLPAAARYLEEGDMARVRDLLLRGTRYVVAAVVPVTVILMALAQPLLVVWLGDDFRTGAVALTILISYWLVASTNTVSAPMLVAVGRARTLAWYAGGVAIMNLGLSLALTPSMGLKGVVLGTAIPYFVFAPYLLSITLREFPVTLRDFSREVWVPVFSLAVPMGAALVALRLTVSLESLPRLLAVAGGSLALYAVAFYLLWATPGERLLVRSLPRRRGSAAA
jgi:O-antigen/teichoic acid export membrane protein